MKSTINCEGIISGIRKNNRNKILYVLVTYVDPNDLTKINTVISHSYVSTIPDDVEVFDVVKFELTQYLGKPAAKDLQKIRTEEGIKAQLSGLPANKIVSMSVHYLIGSLMLSRDEIHDYFRARGLQYLGKSQENYFFLAEGVQPT